MKIRRSGAFALLIAIVFSLFLSLPLKAQDSQDTTVEMSAEAGYDGMYKGEYWLPVHISVSNSGPTIEGRLRVVVGDNTSRNRVIYGSPITLPTQSNKRQTIYVYLPNLTSDLTAELVGEDQAVIAVAKTNRLERLSVDELLYGVMSSEPDEFTLLQDVKGNWSDAAVAFLTPADLPQATAAWSALDVIVLHDVDSSAFSQEQLEALEGWLSTGGQLVVTGGPDWQRSTTAVTELLPVTVTGTDSVTNLPALSTFGGLPFRDPGPYLVTTSNLQNGELLIHQDGMPLLARTGYGRGSVYFLALDPNLAPLKDWDGSVSIWEEIAALVPRQPSWAIGARNGYAADSAVSSLPALALPSALGLTAFLLFYVLVAGPINYVVLKRMGRRELAWLTIPAIVLFFCGISYIAGFQLKGNDTIVNQMSIAYGSADGNWLRTQTILGVYSPRRATFDVLLPGKTPVRPFDQNFGSLSGGGNIDRVEQGQDTVVRAMRVDVSDIGTLVAESYQPALPVAGQAVLRLDSGDLTFEVTVQNNSDLNLENASILVGQTAVSLGDIKPGDVTTVAQKLDNRSPSAAGVPVAGMSIMPPGAPPASSPLAANYATILGGTNYYDDTKLFPRWQLLESLAPDYGSNGVYYPRGTATLIAWSQESLLDVQLDKQEFDLQATTLYLVEFPLRQNVVSGNNVTIPPAMLDWQVIGESGIYNPRPNDLYLPPGWVEFEYLPWPELQSMDVSALALLLRSSSTAPEQSLPALRIWDWNQDQWVTLDINDRGRIIIEDYDTFMGPGNAVRIRLQNDSLQGLEIDEIFPELTGDLQ